MIMNWSGPLNSVVLTIYYKYQKILRMSRASSCPEVFLKLWIINPASVPGT